MKQLAAGLVLIVLVATRPARAQGPGEAGQAGSAPVLTLQDAIALSKKQNRRDTVSQLDVTKASEATQIAKAARLPAIGVDLRAGETLRPIDVTIPEGAFGVFPPIGPIPARTTTVATPQRLSGFVDIAVAQPISQFHKINLAVDASAASEQLARQTQRATEQDVVTSVRSLYYQLGAAQAQLAAARSAEGYLTELAGLTDRRLEAGTALRADSLSVHARLAAAHYQTLVLSDSFDTDRESLNELLGRDLSTAFSVEPLAAPPAPDPPPAVEAAQDRPELREADLRQAQAAIEVRRARADFLPDVTAQVAYLSFPHVDFVPQNVVTAGILVSWTPFDWGVRRRKVAEEAVALEQARLARADTDAQVSADVRARTQTLTEAYAGLAAATAALDAATEALRLATDRYNQQNALLADLLQQQSASVQADRDYQQALASLWVARAALDRSLGRMP